MKFFSSFNYGLKVNIVSVLTMVLYNAVDFLTAKVWQTSNERTEADFTGKCSYVEILYIHHAYSKCEYSGVVSFAHFVCLSGMLSC